MIDVKVTTADSVNEPLSLETVKYHLRIFDDTTDDGYIESLIKPAREKAEQVTGLSLVAHTIVIEDSANVGETELLYPPIGEVSKVERFDGEDWRELEEDAYTVGGLRAKWVITSNSYRHIRITYGTTAENNGDLKRLMMDLIQNWYDNRPDIEEGQEKIVKRMQSYKEWRAV